MASDGECSLFFACLFCIPHVKVIGMTMMVCVYLKYHGLVADQSINKDLHWESTVSPVEAHEGCQQTTLKTSSNGHQGLAP